MDPRTEDMNNAQADEKMYQFGISVVQGILHGVKSYITLQIFKSEECYNIPKMNIIFV